MLLIELGLLFGVVILLWAYVMSIIEGPSEPVRPMSEQPRKCNPPTQKAA